MNDIVITPGNSILAFTSSNGEIISFFVTESAGDPLLVLSGTSSPLFHFSGSAIFVDGFGLSGSLTHLADGTSYIKGEGTVTVTTGSNGGLIISGTGDGNSGGGGGSGGTSWTSLYSIDFTGATSGSFSDGANSVNSVNLYVENTANADDFGISSEGLIIDPDNTNTDWRTSLRNATMCHYKSTDLNVSASFAHYDKLRATWRLNIENHDQDFEFTFVGFGREGTGRTTFLDVLLAMRGYWGANGGQVWAWRTFYESTVTNNDQSVQALDNNVIRMVFENDMKTAKVLVASSSTDSAPTDPEEYITVGSYEIQGSSRYMSGTGDIGIYMGSFTNNTANSMRTVFKEMILEGWK